MIIINAFVSGLLFLVYKFIENWFWIFMVGMFIAISVIENSQTEKDYVDDERRIV